MDKVVIWSLFHPNRVRNIFLSEKNNPGEVFIKNSFQVIPAGQFSVSNRLMKTQVILRNEAPFHMKGLILTEIACPLVSETLTGLLATSSKVNPVTSPRGAFLQIG